MHLVRLATPAISSEKIGELFEILKRLEDFADPLDLSLHRQANKKLHLIIAEASGNALLSNLYSIASNAFPDWMLYERVSKHTVFLPQSLEDEYQQHALIVQAISNRNIDLAVESAVNHLRSISKEMIRFLCTDADVLEVRERQIWPHLNLGAYE